MEQGNMDSLQDFTVEEFAERRRRLAGDLEPGAVALIPGAGAPQGAERF